MTQSLYLNVAAMESVCDRRIDGFLLDKPYIELFKERSDKDFVRRTRSGVLIYVLAYPLLIFSTGVYHHHLKFCIIFFILMNLIAAIRLWLEYLFSTPFYRHRQLLWRRMVLGSALAHAICWSIIFSSFVGDPSYMNVSITMVFGLIAIISGATNTLIPKGHFFNVYVAILVAPMIVMLVVGKFHISLLLVLLCFWAYTFFLGNQIYSEYVHSFKSEYEAGKNKEALEALSKTDSLTGIFNRHHFNESIEQQWHICLRNQYPLSLIMMDVDHFKQINDTYGHILGDECLVHVASVMKSVVKRSTDIVTRYGGEEFAIILPDTAAPSAFLIAEKIRQQLAGTPFCNEQVTLSVTVSCGVSSNIPSQRSTVLELLANADTALYLAKNSGRNRVKSYYPPTLDSEDETPNGT